MSKQRAVATTSSRVTRTKEETPDSAGFAGLLIAYVLAFAVGGLGCGVLAQFVLEPEQLDEVFPSGTPLAGIAGDELERPLLLAVACGFVGALIAAMCP